MLDDPAEQFWHAPALDAFAVFENVPAGHRRHDESDAAPLLLPKVPCGHGMHDATDGDPLTSTYVPAGHGWHCVDADPLYVPAGHAIHIDELFAPVVLLYDPAGQAMHALLDPAPTVEL